MFYKKYKKCEFCKQKTEHEIDNNSNCTVITCTECFHQTSEMTEEQARKEREQYWSLIREDVY